MALSDMQSDGLARIHQALRELDPELPETDETYRAAVIMLAPAMTNCAMSAEAIEQFVGEDPEFVARIVANLQKNKIWDGETINHSGWFDEENGGAAFWLDVTCAAGLIERAA